MKKVLIVDDSRIFSKVLEKIMRAQFEVVGHGSNGDEGFELFKKMNPDIVLLDITMPICSGKECLEKIIAFNPAAVVIMISSLEDDKTVEECLSLGAKAFIKKQLISAQEESAIPTLEMIQNAISCNARRTA